MTESPDYDNQGLWQVYLDSVMQYYAKPGWQVLDKDGLVVNEGPGIELSGEGSA